jgi:hypothetical protein
MNVWLNSVFIIGMFFQFLCVKEMNLIWSGQIEAFVPFSWPSMHEVNLFGV